MVWSEGLPSKCSELWSGQAGPLKFGFNSNHALQPGFWSKLERRPRRSSRFLTQPASMRRRDSSFTADSRLADDAYRWRGSTR
jgi:hypothetical protein